MGVYNVDRLPFLLSECVMSDQGQGREELAYEFTPPTLMTGLSETWYVSECARTKRIRDD